ncbi:uncharacterized protein NPIL_101081 [Nephila pilipes]|uniref:Uncharacterized protein n=1 Tax=Nephila pilipes TaxID=299642 RepID=A0A8X6QX38_NEPPI|nr:uncharacterized protein NPIL_101081 [Nephila pilipes]
MLTGNPCAGGPTRPSGHTNFCCTGGHTPPCNANITCSHRQQKLPSDFVGPFKAFNPPGWREPAVGNQERGDVPYLPSYLDPLNPVSKLASGKCDNLFMRGPFFRGVSETHDQFVNREIVSPQIFHEFVRHYEEPGMKYDKSITQTDFVPPKPMLPRDKFPCLKEQPSEPQYVPQRPQLKTIHAKELEFKLAEPQLVYIDKEPEQKLTTEAEDNYVCYQKQKTENKPKDYIPPKNELFTERLLNTHACPYGFPREFICDGNEYETDGIRRQNKCPEKTPWLLFPRNYEFPNGYMILPSNAQECQCPTQQEQCRYQKSQQFQDTMQSYRCNSPSHHYKFYPVLDQCQHKQCNC